MKRFLSLVFIAVTLSACDAILGKEVARMEMNQTSNKELFIKEAKLTLKEGQEVSFWTDVDMEFEDEVALVYVVEVWKDTTLQGSFELNALETNPTLLEARTTFQNKTSWSYHGKMDFLTVDKGGDYTFRAIIRSSENPTLVLKRANLILKE